MHPEVVPGCPRYPQSWKMDGKIVGKPWENHGKILYQWMFEYLVGGLEQFLFCHTLGTIIPLTFIFFGEVEIANQLSRFILWLGDPL